MSWIMIDKYWLQYDLEKLAAKVCITYTSDSLISSRRTKCFTLPPGDAIFLADMLRYEKPVYYDPETNLITTGEEPVGEEESSSPKPRRG